MDAKRTVGQPHDRLTRLCDAMLATLKAHPEYQEDKVIVMLSGKEGGGLVLSGYKSDLDAVTDLLVQADAVFTVNGRRLRFTGMPGISLS